MLPGLWLTPAQAYAVLTLNNMVEKIAPNVLGPFLHPMRGLLKQMLLAMPDYRSTDSTTRSRSTCRQCPQIGDLDFENLVDALINEQPARFTVRTKAGLEHTLGGTPVKLRITAGRLERDRSVTPRRPSRSRSTLPKSARWRPPASATIDLPGKCLTTDRLPPSPSHPVRPPGAILYPTQQGDHS